MNVMTIFDVVIVIFGIYMVAAGLKMKKSGVISAVLVTEKEIAACKDKKGFIDFMYWKEALFGGLVALLGALGLVDSFLVSIAHFSIVQMLTFLAAFFWFCHELTGAREKFMKKF